MKGSVRRPRSQGGYWSYRIDLGIGSDGRRDQKQVGGFRTRKAAEAALAEELSERQRGEWVEPTKRTVAEFLDAWIEGVRVEIAESAWANYGNLIRSYVKPGLGDIRLTDLTPQRVQAFYAELLASGKRDGTGLAPRSVSAVHKVLHRALQDAVRWHELPRNPADAVKRPRVTKGDLQVWSAEEARRFLVAVHGDRLFALWVLALHAGMRRGELAGLRWSEVDLAAGTVAVTRQRTTANYRVIETEPKARSWRVIPIDTDVVDALRDHHDGQLKERKAAGPVWEDTGYVFVAENGRPYHPSRLGDMFVARCRAVGLRHIRLHDLRHTMASLALQAGIHPKIVQERLGHASIAMTLDTYSHVMPSLQREAAQQLSSLLSGKEPVAAG